MRGKAIKLIKKLPMAAIHRKFQWKWKSLCQKHDRKSKTTYGIFSLFVILPRILKRSLSQNYQLLLLTYFNRDQTPKVVFDFSSRSQKLSKKWSNSTFGKEIAISMKWSNQTFGDVSIGVLTPCLFGRNLICNLWILLTD